MGTNVNYTPICVKESAVQDGECIWLYKKALEMDSIVEIGSWVGKSTHALLSGCKGTVYAVDHFQGSKDPSDPVHRRSGKEEFLKNCGHFPNLKLLEMPSGEAVKLFKDKSVDMIWIDGGHLTEEVVEDVTLWKPKARKLICGHDVVMGTVWLALQQLQLNWRPGASTIWEASL